MSKLTRWLRKVWVEIVRLGLNRLPGVRWLARYVKRLMFRLQYRGRSFVLTPDDIKIHLWDDPDDLIKWDYIPYIMADEWQRPVVDAFRNLRPGQNAIDVGAAFGYLTLVGAKAVGPSGTVLSFEPETTAYRNLQRNIALNDLSNVIARQAAVTDRAADEVALFGAPMGATIVEGSAAHAGLGRISQESVPAVTIDDMVAARGTPPIHLVKLDIEGGEPLAFRGMRDTLERNRDHLMVIAEIGLDMLEAGGFSADDFFEPLLAAGYDRIFDITGKGVRNFDRERDLPRLKRREIGNTSGTADLLFMARAPFPSALGTPV